MAGTRCWRATRAIRARNSAPLGQLCPPCCGAAWSPDVWGWPEAYPEATCGCGWIVPSVSSTAALRASLLRGGQSIRPAREFIEEAMRDCPARDNFHRLNWLDLTMTLPSQMLTKVDRTSMAHSLEVRVPFLDHRLVELMAPVSAQVKLPGYRRKHVLLRAMGRKLPPEVRRAPKRGFNVPVREWFREEASLSLLSRHFAAAGLDEFLDRRALQGVLDTHRRGRDDHGALIWILLQLATWCERSGGVPQQV